MAKHLNVGVIGVGRLGAAYARYFSGRIQGAKLVAISDTEEKTLSSIGEDLSIEPQYSRYQDLIADPHVDAIVIVSPTSTHKEIVLEAAKQRKPTFCEKPLSIFLDAAEEMQRAVDQSGMFFQMGFMRRFDKGYVAAKQKIAAGGIGTPVLFKSSSRDPYRPSLEYLDPAHCGGLIVDCAIHDLDLARWVMG